MRRIRRGGAYCAKGSPISTRPSPPFSVLTAFVVTHGRWLINGMFRLALSDSTEYTCHVQQEPSGRDGKAEAENLLKLLAQADSTGVFRKAGSHPPSHWNYYYQREPDEVQIISALEKVLKRTSAQLEMHQLITLSKLHDLQYSREEYGGCDSIDNDRFEAQVSCAKIRKLAARELKRRETGLPR